MGCNWIFSHKLYCNEQMKGSRIEFLAGKSTKPRNIELLALAFFQKPTPYKINLQHIIMPGLPQHLNFSYGVVIWCPHFSCIYQPGATF